MVQNTNILLYHSTIMCLYYIYITQHPYCLQNISFTELHFIYIIQYYRVKLL